MENNEIKELKQRQLINRIINRKNLEVQATIMASKELMNSPQEVVVKRKNEIFKELLKKQEQKDNEEVEKLRQKLEKKAIDEELQKWKQQEKQEKENRARKVEEILKQINDELKLERIKKEENDALRKKVEEKEKKSDNIRSQLAAWRVETKKKRQKEEDKEREENKQKEVAQNVDVQKEVSVNPFKYIYKNKEGKDVEISKDTINNNDSIKPKYKIEKKEKKESVNIRTIKGIVRYNHSMQYFGQFLGAASNYKVNNVGNDRKMSFRDRLSAAVDHKEALRKSRINTRVNTRNRNRYR